MIHRIGSAALFVQRRDCSRLRRSTSSLSLSRQNPVEKAAPNGRSYFDRSFRSIRPASASPKKDTYNKLATCTQSSVHLSDCSAVRLAFRMLEASCALVWLEPTIRCQSLTAHTKSSLPLPARISPFLNERPSLKQCCTSSRKSRHPPSAPCPIELVLYVLLKNLKRTSILATLCCSLTGRRGQAHLCRAAPR